MFSPCMSVVQLIVLSLTKTGCSDSRSGGLGFLVWCAVVCLMFGFSFIVLELHAIAKSLICCAWVAPFPLGSFSWKHLELESQSPACCWSSRLGGILRSLVWCNCFDWLHMSFVQQSRLEMSASRAQLTLRRQALSKGLVTAQTIGCRLGVQTPFNCSLFQLLHVFVFTSCFHFFDLTLREF